MTLTSADPEIERDALLFAVLVASSRAALGRFTDFGYLERMIEQLNVDPGGLQLTEQIALGTGIAHRGSEES